MSAAKQNISVEEIRKRYFGERKQPRDADSESNFFEQGLLELTPSARYVLKEAKKRLGQQTAFTESVTPDEEDMLRLVSLVEDREGEELSERERHSVVAALSAALEHYDLLTTLVERPDVNDIIVRSYRDISIQVGRRNVQTDLRFPDKETYKSFVENLLKRAGKACTAATPVVDAAIDPYVRACVTHESFSPPGSGPMLTLRISRHRNVSLDALVQLELAPREILEYLAAVARDGASTLLIAGEVGTGKTTLVKALAHRIREDEAILIIEDTHELTLERRFVRTLLTREANTEGAGRITPAQAIRTGMRMAMNRIILGEMRDGEAAESFIDVCASGHPGISTIHARSARDAMSRLELFLARAQGNVTVDTIRRQIANAVSVVVFLDVCRDTGRRRVFEVFEVGSSTDGIIQLHPMYSYRPLANLPEWRRDAGITQFDRALQKNGVVLSSNSGIVSLEPEHIYRAHTQGRDPALNGTERASTQPAKW